MSARRQDRPVVERLLELGLFGPLDLTIRIVEELPTALEQARNRFGAARCSGRPERARGVHRDAAPNGDEAGRSAPGAVGESNRPRAGVTVAPAEPVPDADDLALPDYDHLPATHIVAKLAGLSQADRDRIERFESAHRHRRTVLGRLDQLREP